MVFYNGSPDVSLESRWQWALDTADEPSFWIAYRINRLMHPRSFYGMYLHGDINREQSMYALIGEPEKFDVALGKTRVGWNFRGDGFFQFGGHDEDPEGQVLKEIAILALYKRGVKEPVNFAVTNMSMEVNFENVPVYWLDHAATQESFDHLTAVYPMLMAEDVKERIIRAIGIHRRATGITPFLSSIVSRSEPLDVRESAVTWLGQQNTQEALDILSRVIEDDPSLDVREHAVYAISTMTLTGAVDLLIDLARNEKNRALREKAIYGLGQQASTRALDTLEETVYNEADTEVQKQAVYALTQFEMDVAVPKLIEIAHNHPNVKVRKQAIFWLGDTADERAVEALIEMVERY